MHAVAHKEDSLERRHIAANEDADVWNNLTLAQKFSASSLTQFGYELSFVRDYNSGSVAVMMCRDNIATISKIGEINTAPTITLRN
jgi:hypothetical protein